MISEKTKPKDPPGTKALYNLLFKDYLKIKYLPIIIRVIFFYFDFINHTKYYNNNKFYTFIK